MPNTIELPPFEITVKGRFSIAANAAGPSLHLKGSLTCQHFVFTYTREISEEFPCDGPTRFADQPFQRVAGMVRYALKPVPSVIGDSVLGPLVDAVPDQLLLAAEMALGATLAKAMSHHRLKKEQDLASEIDKRAGMLRGALKDNLGAPLRGRPKGAKKLPYPQSKQGLYEAMSRTIRYLEDLDIEPTRMAVAQALDLANAKSLDRLRKAHRDKRRWLDVVAEAGAAKK